MDYIVKAYKDWKLHSQFQEIVPDMDDDNMFNEKQSIRDSARSLKKYGSTCCNHMRNNDPLIRHDVEKTDTLQGIALKYGCTTEQIRRVNRLFASDSLFLRQFLLIPVDKTSPYYPKPDEINIITQQAIVDSVAETGNTTVTLPSNTDPLSNHFTTIDEQNSFGDNEITSYNPRTYNNVLPARPYSIAGELNESSLNNQNANSSCGGGSGGSGNNKQSKSLDSVVAMTPEEENRKCINEFLSKIDSTISESRKYVERSQEMVTSQSDVDLVISADFVERRRNNHLNNSYKQQQPNHIRHSSTGSSSDTAQLLNTTQMRRVQNSLKRLEKQQDEFFEL